jgi:glycyl-tRNA synthetase beta chain
MSARTLLVELLTEELPPRSLPVLSQAFATGIAAALRAGQFLAPDSRVTPLATPRRLAVHISQVLGRSPDRMVREKIMPVAVALDANGAPSPALQKKLAQLKLEHVGLAELERAADGRTETFFYSHLASGQSLAQCLQNAVAETLAKLPAPKVMRYQINAGTSTEKTVQFARPARGLIALWGEDVVPISALGLAADRVTRGHRFLSSGPLLIPAADAYIKTLHESGRVVASFEDRRTAIREQLLRAAQDLTVLMPDELLDEVTALVEWPHVYRAGFEHGFLAVPQECLVLTMQRNQRYFALTDSRGAMQNHFLLVSNIASDDASLIIAGNERVLRARLSDAKFFFEQDQKKTLLERLPALEKIVYHKLLGSVGARARRVAALAQVIALRLGADAGLVQRVERAALLAKADLVTDMVGEFPELQGIMGRYYALHDGEPEDVAEAIEEHYRPRFAGDLLPKSRVGICVALADKLETLVGMFGVGNVPSGDRDPYALRRGALGVLRILVEHRLPLELGALLEAAHGVFAGVAGMKDPSVPLREFLSERLRTLLREQGFSVAEVEALVSLGPERIDVLPEQLQAVRSFALMPESASLAAANKRIGNILKKSEGTAQAIEPALLIEPAEKHLAAALGELGPLAERQFASADYTAMLKSLSALRAPVDDFFEHVMVMAPDASLRRNRLALLGELYRLMNRFADLSKLAA